MGFYKKNCSREIIVLTYWIGSRNSDKIKNNWIWNNFYQHPEAEGAKVGWVVKLHLETDCRWFTTKISTKMILENGRFCTRVGPLTVEITYGNVKINFSKFLNFDCKFRLLAKYTSFFIRTRKFFLRLGCPLLFVIFRLKRL